MGAIVGDELVQWKRTQGADMPEVREGDSGGTASGKMDRILVSVRLRPLSEKEIAMGEPCDWECINNNTIIFRNSLPERNMLPTAYTFDTVFRGESTTKQVYEEAAKEVALSAVAGINSSIFAYGQTSSGKTYTMNGITEYTVADIYDYIKSHEDRAFVLKFSAMEIYNEAVKDLLSTDSTPLRVLDDPERGTIIEKLTEETLRDWSQLKELLSICEAHRKTGETSLNETSSRSHQILRLTIESSAREFLGRDNTSTLVASVNFVDLAGSERASQALSVGARLKEGCHINRSLLTLGTVIRKLSNGRNGHIPYRESKLTRILQPSLGGNARTAIICTMCPARSHIEQSKNTLLFASCAKEVVMNARVNVVMSDKALVKHLQKELARLENELKCPGWNSNIRHFEVVLREKDVQIKKMEKEIKGLIQERDLARSRLEDLLRVTRDHQPARQWDEVSHFATSHETNACEDALSISDTSGIVDQGLDNGFTMLRGKHGRNSCTSNRLQLFEKPKEQDYLSPSHSISNPRFVIQHQSSEETAEECFEDNEELCKEVRCIEIDESSTFRSEEPNSLFTEGNESTQPVTVDSNRHGDHELQHVGDMDLRPIGMESSFITLEQQLKNARKTIVNLAKPYPDVSSGSRGLGISRSRSCRAIVMNSLPSSWFEAAEQNDCTPPSRFLKDYPGRPEGFQRRHIVLNYGDEAEVLQGLREVSQIKLQTEFTDDHVWKEQNTNESPGVEGTAKDMGVDTMLDPLESPSQWPIEFEKKLQEIIKLWHTCNVSLVHRTYFFLLFKGDPADSIYMEVELRRLSFLRRSFSRGSLDQTAALTSQNISLRLSMRNLRHEREMLYKRMHKRLSIEDRESLYIKWGIALDSKQRRLQLAHRLWFQTDDIEHIRESASLVARLIGLLEPEKALKEMFGLSFTPQQTNRRSYGWKRGIYSTKGVYMEIEIVYDHGKEDNE